MLDEKNESLFDKPVREKERERVRRCIGGVLGRLFTDERPEVRELAARIEVLLERANECENANDVRDCLSEVKRLLGSMRKHESAIVDAARLYQLVCFIEREHGIQKSAASPVQPGETPLENDGKRKKLGIQFE